jgi:preprotein translocase subunit SecF
MGVKDTLLGFYDRYYKELMLFTIFLLLLSLGFLGWTYLKTGEFIQKGVSLKGGLTITIPVDREWNVNDIQNQLSADLPNGDITVRGITETGTLTSIIVEAGDVEEPAIISSLEKTGLSLKKGEYTTQFMGSSLGNSFFRQTIIAVIVAFLAMSIVVLITFRNLVPSLFVILCATSDIVSTFAVVSFLGVKLSTAGVAAFLMLIGYSVDTDILLTTRVLRGKHGTVFERVRGAMGTGLAMSMTSFVAVLVGYFFTSSDTIKQIMLVLAIGLVFDILYTWIQNAGILRWYMERKEKKVHQQ